MTRLRCALFAAVAFFWACRAQAVTVALLRPPSGTALLEEAVFRLQGELLALGASVTMLDGPSVSKPASDSDWLQSTLERTARERGIDAFIAVSGDDRALEADVWIRDKSSPRLRFSRVTVERGVDDRTAALAIRAIEVLRSSFLAIDLAAGNRPAERPAKAAVAPSSGPPPDEHPDGGSAPALASRLGLEAGASAVTSFGHIGPAIMPLLQIDEALGSGWSLQATAAGFGTRPRVRTPAGDVEVTREFALIGACLCAPLDRRIRPFFALSAGALRTALDASPNAPNLGHRAQRWAALADAGVGARRGFADRFYLTAAAHLQLAEPYVAIHVLDEVVATTGLPNVLLTLTVGVHP